MLRLAFVECFGKTNEENDPDVAKYKQKELSKCDAMVNYPGQRTSLGDFEI